MLYLLDANVLIDANRDYYGINRVPEFWLWLTYHGEQGSIKLPLEIYEEVAQGKDDLATWIKQTETKQALLLKEEADASLVTQVVHSGYSKGLDESDLLKLGRDPFLISYALKNASHRCVVTTETSKPSKRNANRHIPDVCSTLGVRSCNTFTLTRELDFSTNWKNA